MADERAKPDANRAKAGVVSGVTNNAALEIVQLRVDPTTKRLLVDTTGDVTQYDIQDIQGSTDTGTVGLAVRNDDLADLSGGDGAYAPIQVTDIGAVWMEHAPNLVDSGNSSTSTLTSGSTFTGTGVDVLHYDSVTIQIFANQDSASSGMRFEFSNDNSNWDVSHQHDYKASTGRVFQFATHSRYFRVVFVNGGTGQGTFRLQTLLRHNTAATTIRRLDQQEAPDRSSIINKSVLMGQEAGTGNFLPVEANSLGALEVEPEQHVVIDALSATSGWAALGNDTLNLATTKNHIVGTDALTFDKVDGDANTVFAGIEKTVTSLDFGNVSPHDIIQNVVFLSSTAVVDYVFVRLGTDSSNYNEWRISADDLTTNEFNSLVYNLGDASQAGSAGNGWNPSAVTYAVVGVAFDTETDELSGIIFDQLSFHTNLHTSAALGSEVTSSVNTANVNLHKIKGSPTDKGQGNASNGSQRIVIADDDTNLAAIKTATEAIDGAIAGPGEPSIDSVTQFAINLSAGANQVLVSSSPSKQIWVYAVAYTCSVAGTVSFQDEDDTAITGILDHAAKSGLAVGPSGNFSMPLWKLGTNKDLEVDVVTAAIDGWITYAIVSV